MGAGARRAPPAASAPAVVTPRRQTLRGVVTDAVPTAARIARELLAGSASEAELARLTELLARLS